jgi:hypothetical protein
VDTDLVIRCRRIDAPDLALIRRLVAEEGHRGRTHLSRRLCELWDWRQTNGRYREIACRDLLRRLQVRGLVTLPAPLHAARRAGYRNRFDPLPAAAQMPLVGALGPLRPGLEVQPVLTSAQRQTLKSLLGGYHYLGYQQATGAHRDYLGWYQGRPIAAVSFGPAAWKVAARDHYLGWSAPQRQARLPWVVNNNRFLLPPWVQVPHLASWVLSRCLRRLPVDWQATYGQDLALVETFIEKDRFAGHCYAAANWQCVGQSLGRGRNDRYNQQAQPIKTVWVYPLRPDVRELLLRAL